MIPRKLTRGQTLGVIAPSDPMVSQLKPQLETGIQTLERLGFQIKLSPNLYANSLGFAASSEEKAADIHAVFEDPEIAGILCAQGGDSANAPLSLLDWELIRQNPKIFLGISDITVLLNAIHSQTGLVTFHGNDLLWGFGRETTAYERQMFEKTLLNGETGSIPPNGPRKTIRSGQAEGTLLGGNLRCLLKLAGTPFWPDFTGAILFLEAYHITPKACHTAFHQLAQMGVFDQINGAVVGYIDSMQRDGGQGPFMEDVLLEVNNPWYFPILKTNDFGHNCSNAILPVGGKVRMDANRLELEIIEQCVS